MLYLNVLLGCRLLIVTLDVCVYSSLISAVIKLWAGRLEDRCSLHGGHGNILVHFFPSGSEGHSVSGRVPSTLCSSVKPS